MIHHILNWHILLKSVNVINIHWLNEMDSIRKSFKISTLLKSTLYWYPSSQNHPLWSQTFWWEHVFHPKVKSSTFSTLIHYLHEPPYNFCITKHFPHNASAIIPYQNIIHIKTIQFPPVHSFQNNIFSKSGFPNKKIFWIFLKRRRAK